MEKYKFGDYIEVEHGSDNEFYTAKVINQMNSNTYVNVPIKGVTTQRKHDKIEPVVSVIICGVSETSVIKLRVEDVRIKEKCVK